jgi:uncharacterized membrane protein
LPDENKQTGVRPRIEGLSDLIFGLALSLSAYSLLSRPPTTLTGLASDFLAISFSFLILISVWVRYTAIMSVLPMENTATRILNVAMLFSVSLVPYLFNLVTLYGHATETVVVEYASVFFAADMAALVTILAFFIHELAVEEKQLICPGIDETLQKSEKFNGHLNFPFSFDDGSSILAMEFSGCTLKILSLAGSARNILGRTVARETGTVERFMNSITEHNRSLFMHEFSGGSPLSRHLEYTCVCSCPISTIRFKMRIC